MATLPPSPFIGFTDSTPGSAERVPLVGPSQPLSEAGPTGGRSVLDELGFYVSPPEHSDTSDIGEIFNGARKLEDNRFVLDVALFMEALEEPPLFLRRAM